MSRAKIDWDRVKKIIPYLKKWMYENNYEKIDIQRALSYLEFPEDVPTCSDTPTEGEKHE